MIFAIFWTKLYYCLKLMEDFMISVLLAFRIDFYSYQIF